MERSWDRVVLLRGELDGNGRHAKCGVVAFRKLFTKKSKLPHMRDFYFTDLGVIDAPADLPEGDYILHVGSLELITRKQRGIWLTCGEPDRHPPVPPGER